MDILAWHLESSFRSSICSRAQQYARRSSCSQTSFYDPGWVDKKKANFVRTSLMRHLRVCYLHSSQADGNEFL